MSLAIASPLPKGTSTADDNSITTSSSSSDLEKHAKATTISITETTTTSKTPDSKCAPLGEPSTSRGFRFRRSKQHDPNAIATQPSVFDDPDLAEEYQPRPDWENIHRFDPSARWTWGEEKKVVRKLDMRIMVGACLMITALELDRSNLQQANADNFLGDLNLTRDDYNLGNTIYRLCYMLSEIPAQCLGKKLGADVWLPIQMSSWSIVACCQFWLSGRKSFLACRALIGILSGGFTPTMILYLSYFYKHHELSIRLGFWYAGLSMADILAGFLAYGILHLRGVGGVAGWRWLFLIEGLLTLVLGITSVLYLPASPTQTANWIRGKKGWFTEREEVVLVNRLIREDPSKGTMHNRQPLTPKLVLKSLSDFDLWPLYIVGLTFLLPKTTVSQYFTLFMRDYGFDTFDTILLAIPYNLGAIVTKILLTYTAEALGSLALMGVVAQIWVLPLLIYMNVVDFSQSNKWVAWTILTLLLSHPSAHALQAGWNSRNSNSVRSRAMAAALYNMCTQLSGIMASNVYQDWDKPRYAFGNRVLLGIACTNIVLYIATKGYYMLRNRNRDRQWTAMTTDQRLDYIATTTDQGNRRLDFRFAH